MLKRTLGAVVPAPFDKWFLATGYAAPQDGPTGSANLSNGSKVLYEALRGDKAGVAQTIDLFQGQPKEAVVLAALGDAAKVLQARFGDATPMAQWRAPTVPMTFRANNFFGIPQANAAEAVHTPVYMNRGTENDLIVMGAKGSPRAVDAWDVVAPGQSGFVAPDGTVSEHYADQLGLYTGYGRKRIWQAAEDIKRNTRSTEVLVIERR